MKYNSLLSFLEGMIETAISRKFKFEDIAESSVRSLVFSQTDEVLVEILRQKPELLTMPVIQGVTLVTGGQLLRMNLELMLMSDLSSIFVSHNKSFVSQVREQCAA